MPDWSKGRGQMKNSPWSSRLGVKVCDTITDNPLPEKESYYRNQNSNYHCTLWEAGVQDAVSTYPLPGSSTVL